MKVSVIVRAYNLEPYIAQALESVLMQRTNFDYEIVVGEDCSTDGTRAIVREYARLYPERIRLILPDENLGGYGNIIWAQAMEMVRGSYVAWLDGDDYWTAPDKLQKQSDFLDTHPECAICFHNVHVIEEGRSWQINNFRQKKISSLRDIVATNFIGSCSTMYRHGLFGPLPAWFDQTPNSDWPLHILNAKHGKIGYIDEEMSVYRIHSQGVWSSSSRSKRLGNVIEMFRLLRYHRHLTPQLADAAISQYLYALAYESWRQKRWGVTLRCLRRAFMTCPFSTLLPQTLWRQWQRRRGVR